MQDEVNEKVVSLAIKTSKLTAEVLQKAMKALLAKGKGQLTKAPHGKITMRQLMKQGEKVSNIEITDQNIKAFDPIARKSGLDYNVKKIENGKPPTYLVSFKGKDIDVMTEAFREFTAKKLGRDKKPSIYNEDGKRGLTENINAALPFMDEDMRELAKRTLAKIAPLTENEYAELAIFAADEV